jgi:raffinose/stachyose/melibiose transport system permease protein
MARAVRIVLLYALAILLLIFTGYPFLYMFSVSLQSQADFFQHPTSILTRFDPANYRLVFELGIDRYFGNSLLVAAVAVPATVVLSAMVSYPVVRARFRLSRPLFLLFLAGMMIPVHTTLIPVYVLSQKLGLYDTIGALIGPYIAFNLPVSVVVISQFMNGLPAELDEAARIDGASRSRLFWSILLPLLTPAVATIGIYDFIHIWNEFVFGLVLLTTPERMTLPLGLRAFYGEFMVNVPGIMAALTLGTLPLLIAYFAAQEKVVAGLAAGAVKG